MPLQDAVPPSAIIPEFDVFVGSVAITPYETPGTKKFAETVIPFVKDHNTILLGNHGIVCWADTPTHAEWYAENLETYCWTLLISSQLGVPYAKIPSAKEQDLARHQKAAWTAGCPFPTKSGNALRHAGAARCDCAGSAGRAWKQASFAETVRRDEIEAIIKTAVDAAIAAIKPK